MPTVPITDSFADRFEGDRGAPDWMRPSQLQGPKQPKMYPVPQQPSPMAIMLAAAELADKDQA